MKRLSVIVALLAACAIGAVAVLLVSGRAESKASAAPAGDSARPAPLDLTRP